MEIGAVRNIRFIINLDRNDTDSYFVILRDLEKDKQLLFVNDARALYRSGNVNVMVVEDIFGGEWNNIKPMVGAT